MESNGNGNGDHSRLPSRKIKGFVYLSASVLLAMSLATLMKTPVELAVNVIYILGLGGGVLIGGQSWVDRFNPPMVSHKADRTEITK